MRLRPLALVSIVLGAVALPAVAEAAYTTGNVNLRAGPDTGYQVLTTLPPGTHVRVLTCQPGWCQVRLQGTFGWISSSYIAGGPGSYRGPPPPPMMMYPPGPPRRLYRPGPYMMGPPHGPHMGGPPGYMGPPGPMMGPPRY